MRDALAHGVDNGGEFVADGEREGFAGDGVGVAWGRDDVGAAEEFVEVCSADSAELGGELDPAWFDVGWPWDLVEADVTLAVEADGVHC